MYFLNSLLVESRDKHVLFSLFIQFSAMEITLVFPQAKFMIS